MQGRQVYAKGGVAVNTNSQSRLFYSEKTKEDTLVRIFILKYVTRTLHAMYAPQKVPPVQNKKKP